MYIKNNDVLTKVSSVGKSNGKREKYPIIDIKRHVPESLEFILAETNTGIRIINIAFSCTCHPNMKDDAAQIINGFMKFATEVLKYK